jgi:hypothetical protein
MLERDGCTASHAGRSRARAPPCRVGSVPAAGTGSGLRGDKGELVDLANLHARRVRTVHDLGGWHSPYSTAQGRLPLDDGDVQIYSTAQGRLPVDDGGIQISGNDDGDSYV